jgi:hypothetical protein
MPLHLYLLQCFRTGTQQPADFVRLGFENLDFKLSSDPSDSVVYSPLTALAKYLRERGVLDLTECFIDGTFVAAKEGEVM